MSRVSEPAAASMAKRTALPADVNNEQFRNAVRLVELVATTDETDFGDDEPTPIA
jgi:hypothetical protein